MKKIGILSITLLTALIFSCSDYESEVTELSNLEEAVVFMFGIDSTTVSDTLQAVSLEKINSLFSDAFIDTQELWLNDSLILANSSHQGIIAADTIFAVKSIQLTGTDGIYEVEVASGKRSSFAVIDLSSISTETIDLKFYFNSYVTIEVWDLSGYLVNGNILPSLSPEMIAHIWTTEYENDEKINDPALDYAKDGSSLSLDKGQYILRLQKAEAVKGLSSFKMMIVENK